MGQKENGTMCSHCKHTQDVQIFSSSDMNSPSCPPPSAHRRRHFKHRMVGHRGDLVSSFFSLPDIFQKPLIYRCICSCSLYLLSRPTHFPSPGFVSLRRSILQQLLVSITFPNFLEAGESGQNDAFLIRLSNING